MVVAAENQTSGHFRLRMKGREGLGGRAHGGLLHSAWKALKARGCCPKPRYDINP